NFGVLYAKAEVSTQLGSTRVRNNVNVASAKGSGLETFSDDVSRDAFRFSPEVGQLACFLSRPLHLATRPRFKPCPRKLAGKAIVTKENICYTLAFRARKPCRHQGIDHADVWFDHKGPPRDYNDDTLDSAAHVLNHARTGIRNSEI
ncbi:hypothetical protein BHE74_00041371, partial [Ensete ventricosum]